MISRPRPRRVRWAWTPAIFALGCGGSSPNGASSHEPLPQLVYQNGDVILAPKIVTVTFPGDANAAALEAFDDELTASSWWDTVRASFCVPNKGCVQRGTSGGHVELTSPPATAYSDATDGSASTLQAFLAEQVSSGAFPAPDANTVYVVYVPASTVITLTESASAPSQTSCAEFGGYHNSLLIQGAPVAYAVVPECPPASGTNLTAFSTLTFAASHEILEAVTDPVQGSLGFYLDVSDNSVASWNLLGGGEAADLCVDVTGLNQDQTMEDGYTVQRIWSNANAAAGLDPCVPTPPGDVYFNVAPTAPNSFIVLDVGQSKTFDAYAFASGNTPAWQVGGLDWYSAEEQAASPLLTFAFNGQTSVMARSGDKIEVTVTLTMDPGSLGGAEGLLFSVAGNPASPSAAHVWPILVVTPSEAAGTG